MNPFEHGEVFVTDDGGETDLDLGHYERFVGETPEQGLQRHDRIGLPVGHPQGTQGRLPRCHRPGHPPHHERDQGSDPQARPARRCRHRHHRGRGNGRGHRVAAVPRGDSTGPQGRRRGKHLLRPRHPRSVPQHLRGTQDEADPALGRRTPQPRHPARGDRGPIRPSRRRVGAAQDQPLLRCRPDAVINAVDVPNIYAVPLALHEAGLDDVVCRELTSTHPKRDFTTGRQMVEEMMSHPSRR